MEEIVKDPAFKAAALIFVAFIALDMVNGGTSFDDIIHVALAIAVIYIITNMTKQMK